MHACQLTGDEECVWDPGLVEHALDGSVVQRQGLALPALRIHQEHDPAWPSYLAQQHPYTAAQRETHQKYSYGEAATQ